MPGELFSFAYDTRGRVTWATSPSGEWVKIDQDNSCMTMTSPSLCHLAFINDQMVLNTSSLIGQQMINQGKESK